MNRKILAINALSALQGGGQVYISSILRYAKEFPDIKTYVFAPPQFTHLYDFPGVEVIPCSVPSKSILHRISWERWRLPILLKKLKSDLFFCPGGTINTVVPAGCLTVVTFQNMLIFDTINRQRYQDAYMRFRFTWLEKKSRKSFEDADLVIFLSEYAKKVVDEKVPNRKGLSVVMPHGLDDRFRTAGRNNIPRLKWLPKSDYLLYVSLIDVYKAQVEVVQAYYILCQKRHVEEKLLLVGPEYPRYGRLVRQEIRRLGLQDKVIIRGQIPYIDMPSVYHHAKAHIFASSCENCPNIVLESLGSGRPLFLSNRQPMPEFGGDAAVYFDPYKPNELADLLSQYLDDEKWIKEMGEKAIERSFLYSWEKTAKKHFKNISNDAGTKRRGFHMKVCLINPILFSFQRVRSRSLKNNVGMSFYPPLGLCYIANMLEKNGIKVKIIDRNSLMTKNHSNQFVVDNITEGEIRKFKPDIVGISVTTPTFFDVRCNIVKIIRKIDDEIIIVVGGPHVSALPEDTLRSCSEIDIACRGEGELSMLEIANGNKLEDILGITYRDGENIISNESRKPHDNINDFCFPSRHLVDMQYYCKGNPHVMHGIYSRATTIFTSRGCPYNCTFCAGSVALGRGVRFQSVELVIEEIEMLIKDYKIEGLYFADDMFDVNKDRAVNICLKLIEKNIHKKIYWNAQLRANSMDKKLLNLMKEAGCIRVDVGFESGSQKTLDIINKKTTVAQNYRAAELLHEAGIQIHANMIVGLPGEDMEDLNKTKNFMREIRPQWIGFGEFVPLPGSKLFDELSDRSLINKEDVEMLEGLNFTKLDDKKFYKFVKDVRNKIVNPTRLKNYILQNWKKPNAFLYMLKLIVGFLADTCRSTLQSFLPVRSKHIRRHDK